MPIHVRDLQEKNAGRPLAVFAVIEAHAVVGFEADLSAFGEFKLVTSDSSPLSGTAAYGRGRMSRLKRKG